MQTESTPRTCGTCGRQAQRLTRERCGTCYTRLRRGMTGPPGRTLPPIDPELEALCIPIPDTRPGYASRVFAQIDFSGDCWEWTGQLNNVGYGVTSAGGKGSRRTGAHRAVWQLLVGPIPDGLQYDHLCRNRTCVNPDHGEIVTASVNSRRSYNMAGRHARQETCPKGHKYDSVYTHPVTGRQSRECRKCQRQGALARYYASKAVA